MRRRVFARLALASAASLAAAGPAFGSRAALADASDVRALGDEMTLVLDDGRKIYGSLTLPSRAKAPVVLIIPGSGPIDRNGNTTGAGLQTDMYADLAAALQSRGYASLRYDKRGVGESARVITSERDVRFDDYVSDAVAWLAFLQADARVGPLAIAGHSEGSLIGMLAAAQVPVEAYVSLEGAGRPLAEVLRSQIGPDLSSTPSLLAASERILAALSRGETTNDIPQELTPLFRPSVQPYLISAFRYDPRQAIVKAGKRAAIVQGTDDIQVPVSEARFLAAARPDAKLTIVERMTHVLKIASNPAPSAQIATVYSDASIPLARAVPEAVAAVLSA